MTHEQLLGLLAPLATEERMKEVDHRPEMTALLDIDLEEIAQVVEARRRESEKPLLLHRRGFRIALDDEQALQLGAIFARDLLPRRRPHVLTKGNATVGITVGQEDAPPILLERDVAEMRPAVAVGADGGAEVHVARDEIRAEVPPPLHEARLPGLERSLQAAVAAQIDVVGNAICVIGAEAHVRPAPGPARLADRCRSVAGRRPGRSRWGG